MCVDVRNELIARSALCTLRKRYNQIHKVHANQNGKILQTFVHWAGARAICTIDIERKTFSKSNAHLIEPNRAKISKKLDNSKQSQCPAEDRYS